MGSQAAQLQELMTFFELADSGRLTAKKVPAARRPAASAAAPRARTASRSAPRGSGAGLRAFLKGGHHDPDRAHPFCRRRRQCARTADGGRAAGAAGGGRRAAAVPHLPARRRDVRRRHPQRQGDHRVRQSHRDSDDAAVHPRRHQPARQRRAGDRPLGPLRPRPERGRQAHLHRHRRGQRGRLPPRHRDHGRRGLRGARNPGQRDRTATLLRRPHPRRLHPGHGQGGGQVRHPAQHLPGALGRRDRHAGQRPCSC
jgi:hypothetical protein